MSQQENEVQQEVPVQLSYLFLFRLSDQQHKTLHVARSSCQLSTHPVWPEPTL